MTTKYRTVPTYQATIYVGVRHAYTGTQVHDWWAEINRVCQAYCDKVGLAVAVTKTRFTYTKGAEDGASVGLINYPRYPKIPDEIKWTAIELAGLLRAALHQERVSVVCTDETIMLEGE